MLEEDGATQELADVTPAPSEDDVESSHEKTKSKGQERRPAGRLGEESTKADIKKELLNKVL